ncbi:hypothetical protein SARC_00500 [Sphaeroforma arctica JP610]|uniref:Peptidase M16 N-terminal domain-containing protein n=1 Tax=Sphaeroforma arctica JP610 TaxID=667725 RepID=A0A0L0GEH0_9EUKA|nr:hypothetical protein SARC_00500 [Sphaeroforma arctica JP610]KNC87410.1 hypothetical protein SARC_00500 [Sphaeroforma arctica JP610]|eukprot:XP_014161312.1 hypothetical protein SARC_00500 [Sphaeroforma arctica JP610]
MWRTIHTVQQSAVRSSHLLRRWASSNTALAQNTTAHARISHHKDVRLKVGETVNEFTIKGTESIPELSLTAGQHVHDKTGAVGLHIARADDNNVFSIEFRTPPEDSSGVTHVLQHVSLCGSEKYPCRDPFFNMLSRSMATFMNAWTASDYTMYPLSTQNANDYNYLLDVYLDAVLHPSIRERSDSRGGDSDGWDTDDYLRELRKLAAEFQEYKYRKKTGKRKFTVEEKSESSNGDEIQSSPEFEEPDSSGPDYLPPSAKQSRTSTTVTTRKKA